MNKKPPFREALFFWLKLGFISFGGPAGQIAIMHQYLVEKKKWISNSRFLHAMNFCMILPGPEAQQLAIYSGWLLHGRRGGWVAGIFFILPSVFILLTLSILYVLFGHIPWFQAVFDGLKPAVVAIVVFALYRIGRKSMKSVVHLAIAMLSFGAIFFLNIAFPVIIIGALVVGLVVNYFFPTLLNSASAAAEKADGESEYYINSSHQIEEQIFKPKRFLIQLILALICWVTPFVLFHFLAQDLAFWNGLSLFFTKAALVTFGGAYAVLPYVAQVSVEKLHWLNTAQMMDGLALGETTPGPLIMVLAFVGFMGGHSHYGGSILHGTLALLTTVYFTFLPCFLFVLAGAPLAERSRSYEELKNILPLLSAAVAGVMLNLAVYLGRAVLFPSGYVLREINIFNLIWIVLSLFMLVRVKVNMILWIGISALAGLLRFHFFP
jgi:chromate transporter